MGTINRSLWRCVGVIALVLVAGLGALAEPCTITVQPGESIQEAIDAASPGDVICLAEGVWAENLIIEKSLTLRAAEIVPELQAVIRSAKSGWPVIRISSEEPIDVTIQGLQISGAFGAFFQVVPEWICAHGISVHGKATAVIENNTIRSNNLYGTGVYGSSQVMVENNTISNNNLYGIGVYGSSQVMVENNTISNNNLYGIGVYGASQATIENNTISNNNRHGIWMAASSRATINGNAIRGNHGYGVGLSERPCFDTNRVFAGYVTSSGNIGGGNLQGDYCPEDLAFLFTEEGGELDRRE